MANYTIKNKERDIQFIKQIRKETIMIFYDQKKTKNKLKKKKKIECDRTRRIVQNKTYRKYHKRTTQVGWQYRVYCRQ